MKILLIDDDPDIVDVVVNVFALNWPEAKVCSADNGMAGLELLRAESPDVVILDLGLPDKNGFEVLKDIRQVSYVPVLILTVKTSTDDITKALELGADDYVVKPFSHLVLLARVRAAYNRWRLGSAAGMGWEEETPVNGSQNSWLRQVS